MFRHRARRLNRDRHFVVLILEPQVDFEIETDGGSVIAFLGKGRPGAVGKGRHDAVEF